MKKRAAHRPTVYGPELVAKLCSAIAAGSTIEEACSRGGLNPATFYEWQSTRHEFSEKVQTAKAARLEVLEERWAKATKTDWRAAEAMLRVLKPSRFAQRIHLHVEREFEVAIARLKEAFSNEPEQLERALAALAGEPSEVGAAAPEDGEAGSDAEGGEAIRAAPAVADPAALPQS